MLRARLVTLLLASMLLAGCLGTLAERDAAGAQGAGGAPRLDCSVPCAVTVDAGVRWEPSVAVHPLDPRHVVASSQDQTPDGATGVGRSWGLSHVSTDGGATWRTTRLPGGLQGDPTHPLYPYGWMDDSAVAFLADGTLLWSALVLEPTSSVVGGASASLVVLRSADGGVTFDEVVFVAEGGGRRPLGIDGERLGAGYEFHDKQWFAVGADGLVLLAWDVVYHGHPRCADPFVTEECTEVVVAGSRDGGLTWSPPRVLADGGIYSGAYPLIRDDGGWVVSYRDTDAGEAVVAVSTDEGATWTTHVVDHTTKFPVLAKGAAPSGERLWMAYPRSADHHDSLQDVTLRWSDDGGLTWSAPLTLDEAEHEGRTNPAIAATPDGTGVVVTFWHVQEEGAEMRAVAVRDGVVSAPIVLGRTQGPTSETGDYNGVATLADGAFAVWVARVDGELGVRGARVRTT